MQTNFSVQQLNDPAIARSNEILIKCLQCGYCLPNCPTYQLTGDEMETPRGRVSLIKDMLEKEGEPEDLTVGNIDHCLSCLACLSTCPSFVNYMHLIDHARGYIEDNYSRPLFDRLLRWTLAMILPYPERLRIAIRAAVLARPFSFTLPKTVRAMLAITPRKLLPVSPNDTPQVFPAIGKRKRRVALLTGCAQKVLNTDINDATIRILCRHGCDVVVAKGAACCGALTLHMGRTEQSKTAAAKNIRAWMNEVNGEGLDGIVINTSGCGTVIKEYGHTFRNDVLSDQAVTISALAKDISEILTEIELDKKNNINLRVAYHATCSLQFGQRIRFAPKKLLKAVGFTVIEPRESHVCCGSAATYSMLQPEMSGELKQRKVTILEAIKPDVIAAGNIGCMTQIGSGTEVPVVHTVELLDWATGGPIPRVLQNKKITVLNAY